MKFHIKKLYIWFKKDEEPRTLTFDNNKVNVIRGNSSTGKSNIYAIIDYCLLSGKVNIVFPVINQYAEWYGLEFEVNGVYFAIARKKPDAETTNSDVLLLNESFEEDFYPTSTNRQINLARTELDLAFGFHPTKNSKPGEFRNAFVFNALTESIITSPYTFLNFQFFNEDLANDIKAKQNIFDIVFVERQINKIDYQAAYNTLVKKKGQAEKQKFQYEKCKGEYEELLKQLLEVSVANGIFPSSIWEESVNKQIAELERVEKEFKPVNQDIIFKEEKKLLELKQSIRTKDLQLRNMKLAKQEYEKYIATLNDLQDSLKPVSYIREKLNMEGRGENVWFNHILTSLETSLRNIKETEKKTLTSPIYNDQQIKQLEDEIENLNQEYSNISKSKHNPLMDNIFSYVSGQIICLLPSVKEKISQVDKIIKVEFTLEDEEQMNRYEKMIENHKTSSYSKISELNNCFQKIYDDFKYMEYYESCYTRYNEKSQRLELNDGKSILNYDVIGSQSNYMFLHLCFFLGLHQYMVEQKNPIVPQFLFIDQPSIPYYVGTSEVKSDDEAKLLDAFKAINDFMKQIIENAREEFQIILIEHAPESYWKGERKLNYYKTKAQFENGNTLIPSEIVNKRKKLNESR